MTYTDTFISTAPDTKAEFGIEPKARGNKKTIPQIEHSLLMDGPYTLTQEELTFRTYLIRQGVEYGDLADDERNEMRNTLFLKGQPCLRASSLTKSNGWGAHYNSEGRIAIFPMESSEYKSLKQREDLKQIEAMRSSRK